MHNIKGNKNLQFAFVIWWRNILVYTITIILFHIIKLSTHLYCAIRQLPLQANVRDVHQQDAYHNLFNIDWETTMRQWFQTTYE